MYNQNNKSNSKILLDCTETLIKFLNILLNIIIVCIDLCENIITTLLMIIFGGIALLALFDIFMLGLEIFIFGFTNNFLSLLMSTGIVGEFLAQTIIDCINCCWEIWKVCLLIII